MKKKIGLLAMASLLLMTLSGCSQDKSFFDNVSEINDIIKKDNERNKYYIDTVLINKCILKKLGLIEENIIDSNICTVCNSNLLHSYRKAGENSGRNMAIIEIKK